MLKISAKSEQLSPLGLKGILVLKSMKLTVEDKSQCCTLVLASTTRTTSCLQIQHDRYSMEAPLQLIQSLNIYIQ